MKHVRFLRLLMMACLTTLATGAWAQKTYNSFAEFYANTPDEEEAIVNFNNAQVLDKGFWDDNEGRIFFWFIKDGTLAIELDWRTEQTWKSGDILNGIVHVKGIREHDFGMYVTEVINNEENLIQVVGNEEVVPLELKFSELSPKTHCNEVVHVKADVINVKNENEDYWTMTDGGEHEASWEGDISQLRYEASSKIQPQRYVEFETYDDYIEAYENNQFVRRSVECIAAIGRAADQEGEWLRIFPIEIIDVYDYVPVTFKQKFEGFTSFKWDMYAGWDASSWGGNYNRFFVFKVPEGVKAYSCSVEDGYVKRTPVPAEDDLNGYNSYLLELKDKTFADGDVTVDFKGSWANPWYYYSIEGNMLYGYNTAEETNVDGDTENYKFYRLTLNANQDKGSIGFYWGAEDGGPFTTSPHKVFLAVPRGEAHAAAMPFDGTTGLAGVKTVQTENNDIYSLSGIKVNGNKLPKGVYITNGKKVVIK